MVPLPEKFNRFMGASIKSHLQDTEFQLKELVIIRIGILF